MYVRYAVKSPSTWSVNVTTKQILFDDIFKIINGTHTSVADFDTTVCDVANCVFEGSVPSVYKNFAVSHTDSTVDSDTMITFTKEHSEADSEYVFERKVTIYSDHTSYGVRVRSYFPDSDVYDAFTSVRNAKAGNPGGNTNQNAKFPTIPHNFWLTAGNDTRSGSFNQCTYFDIYMTKDVFAIKIGRNTTFSYPKESFFMLIDAEVTDLDRIAYKASINPARITLPQRQSEFEKRAHSPQYTYVGTNAMMGVWDRDHTANDNSTDGGVMIGMNGFYTAAGMYYDDTTFISNVYQQNMGAQYASSLWSGYVGLLPDPSSLVACFGDSDNNDYHRTVKLITYCGGARTQWDRGQSGNNSSEKFTRTADVVSKHTNHVLKGVWRTTDNIAKDGSSITINGVEYRVLRAHKTGNNDMDNALNRNEACYLIPTTAGDA